MVARSPDLLLVQSKRFTTPRVKSTTIIQPPSQRGVRGVCVQHIYIKTSTSHHPSAYIQLFLHTTLVPIIALTSDSANSLGLFANSAILQFFLRFHLGYLLSARTRKSVKKAQFPLIHYILYSVQCTLYSEETIFFHVQYCALCTGAPAPFQLGPDWAKM